MTDVKWYGRICYTNTKTKETKTEFHSVKWLVFCPAQTMKPFSHHILHLSITTHTPDLRNPIRNERSILGIFFLLSFSTTHDLGYIELDM